MRKFIIFIVALGHTRNVGFLLFLEQILVFEIVLIIIFATVPKSIISNK